MLNPTTAPDARNNLDMQYKIVIKKGGGGPAYAFTLQMSKICMHITKI